MNTSGRSFETILDEILKQKQLLEDLQAENESLHQQLTDLRAGRGIFLNILGQPFPLTGNSDVSSLAIVSNEIVKDDTAPVPAAMLTALAEAVVNAAPVTVKGETVRGCKKGFSIENVQACCVP